MNRRLLCLAHKIHALSCKKEHRAFVEGLGSLENVQQSLLRQHLEANESCAYGQKFRFSEVRSPTDFQRKVPLSTYEEMEPWIEQICEKDRGQKILTEEPVLMFERTSGSSGKNKLIPYTRTFKSSVQRAFGAWMSGYYQKFPNGLGKKSYWSLSPLLTGKEKTPSGIQIGLESDSEYLDPISAFFHRQTSAVSDADIQSRSDWMSQTALKLMECEDLGLISVWSPTFFLSLWEEVKKWMESGRLPSELQRRIVDNPGVMSQALWPGLQMVSSWGCGPSERYFQQLRTIFPHAFLEKKGLMATEGVVTFPLHLLDREQPLLVLASRSHFYEFVDAGSPGSRPLFSWQLKKGGVYKPILTAANGFTRYQLMDLIECTGFEGNTPCFVFRDKAENIADFTGEKLTAAQLSHDLNEAVRNLEIAMSFALFSVVQEHPHHYVLFIETTDSGKLRALETDLELILCQGHHYNLSRQTGQLGPLKVVKVSHGAQTYSQHLNKRGIKMGDIKPSILDIRSNWMEVFQ